MTLVVEYPEEGKPSIGGGSQPSEREVRPIIPFTLVQFEWILLNELIHCCMPYFLVHFFLLGPAVLPLSTAERYSGNILLWWRVESENTNAFLPMFLV
ncbi:hypothetical protein ERO13_A03G133720v2 [Gossypium hirsutum]|uniref:Uncharacterized protein n=1 Tax=Gossypium darwinii TaxID=34276 RepID=A0A5D2H5D0_GOSDA|nr:hypothetical protein ERO13_A03G133720v2 [Gossypium hirsutum]TYH25391.1 hypothetical protein ES288_A03G164600v1 [Gossypium darwinii]